MSESSWVAQAPSDRTRVQKWVVGVEARDLSASETHGRKGGGKNESEGQSWATNLPGLTVKATVGPQFLVGLYILACILVALEPGCWGFLIVSVAARELTAGGQV